MRAKMSVIVLLLALGPSGPLLWAEELRAGAANADITPPTGFPMWGYGARKDAPCDGVLDPLLARAVVLAVGDEKLAIVSLDLGRAPTRAVTAAIRERLRGAGITHLFLGASHTHHGPVLELDTWPQPEKPYTRELEEKLVAVIKKADAARVPARYGVASGETKLNRNRQSKSRHQRLSIQSRRRPCFNNNLCQPSNHHLRSVIRRPALVLIVVRKYG